MGTDIHMVVEFADRFGYPERPEDEVTYTGPPPDPTQLQVLSAASRLTGRRWTCVMAESATYGTRNYAVFNMLAGVRSDTRDPSEFPLRGLPSDATPQARSSAETNHSATWYTLTELRAMEWNQEDHGDFMLWLDALKQCDMSHYPDDIRVIISFDS